MNQSVVLIRNVGDTNLLSASLCVLNVFAHAIIFVCVHACECVNECVRWRERARVPVNSQSHMGSICVSIVPQLALLAVNRSLHITRMYTQGHHPKYNTANEHVVN